MIGLVDTMGRFVNPLRATVFWATVRQNSTVSARWGILLSLHVRVSLNGSIEPFSCPLEGLLGVLDGGL